MGCNMNNNNVSGISFTGLLALIFIVLKLTKVINWSWIWVLCPIWISAILIILIYIGVYVRCNRKISRKNKKVNRKD